MNNETVSNPVQTTEVSLKAAADSLANKFDLLISLLMDLDEKE